MTNLEICLLQAKERDGQFHASLANFSVLVSILGEQFTVLVRSISFLPSTLVSLSPIALHHLVGQSIFIPSNSYVESPKVLSYSSQLEASFFVTRIWGIIDGFSPSSGVQTPMKATMNYSRDEHEPDGMDETMGIQWQSKYTLSSGDLFFFSHSAFALLSFHRIIFVVGSRFDLRKTIDHHSQSQIDSLVISEETVPLCAEWEGDRWSLRSCGIWTEDTVIREIR